MFFDLLAWQILLHVELQKNTKTDIDVSPSVKAQLVKKLRSLQAEERATRGRRTFEDPQLEGSLFDSVRMSYSIVDWLDGITTIEEIVERDLQAGRTLPWIHCALRKEGGCKALGKGVEMQACSRCKAVRYCSPGSSKRKVVRAPSRPDSSSFFLFLRHLPEHQKANWKAHKPMCVLPTWGPSLP
ncbi:hypothetical protein BDY24DRAFT_250508 [Mrakia frigida]|uniref:zinc finger MYND domain-containing protein n=1 Tax=Mrakia frigida TaxID=29902 RepID=UPI003FCC10A5